MPLQLLAFLAAFAVVFFRLPFAFPVAPSASASYVFQFNNRVAVVIFIAGAALFSIYFRGLSLQPGTRDSRVSRISCLVAIATCVAVGWFYYWLSVPDGLFGEATYFHGRLAQLASGKAIYRDFEFAYGPLMLYLPFWTGRLLHLSLIHGYVLFWLADWAVGIWILYRLVNAIEIPSPYRTAIFFIFVLDFAGSILPQGINYAPLRTLLTAALAMVVYAAYRHPVSMPAMVAVSTACAALAAAVSPEHGLAFMAGTLLFFAACARRQGKGYWPSLAVMTLCFVAIAVASWKAGVYATLLAFGAGGYSYPIMPIPAVLCVLGLYLLAACAAYLAFQRRQSDSLAIYLLCICICGIPTCFSRADSGHVQLGAFSALIIGALTLGRYPRASLLAAAAFIYWPGTAPFSGQLTPVREQLERRIFSHTDAATVAAFHILHLDAHREAIESKVARHHVSLIPTLPSDAIVNAPLGFLRQGYVDTSGNVDYGYFSGTENLILTPQVDSVIRWLASHPERSLVLPSVWESICYGFSEADDPGFQFVYGVRYASPKLPMGVYYPLCDFIWTRYKEESVPFLSDNRLWHPL
jgi:hypothetical protein